MKPRKTVQFAAALATLATLACDDTAPAIPEAQFEFGYADPSGIHAAHDPHSIRGIGAGTAMADANGDGKLDIFIATPSDDLGAGLYFGLGTGDFTRSEQTFTTENLLANGAAFADLDNDGDQDLIVIGVGLSQLFENTGSGEFDNITEGSLPTDLGYTATSVAIGDYDNDGLLDLYIANYFDELGTTAVPNQLLKNQGNLSFLDVTQSMGVAERDASWGATWFDHDGDGDLDLYVINDTFATPERPDGIERAVPDALFENRDSQGFVNVASTVGVDGRRASMGIAVGEFSGDGAPDFVISDIAYDHIFFSESGAWDETIVESDFVDGSVQVGWGTALHDIDRDLDLDLLEGRGVIQAIGQLGEVQPNLLRLNDGTGQFGSPIVLESSAQTQQARCVAVGDWDGDNDDDFLIAPYNDSYLFVENRTVTAGSFVRIKLVGNGVTSNRDALGARLRLRLTSGRDLLRWLMPASPPGCWSDSVIEFGLGAESPEELEVTWPDGEVTQYPAPETGQLTELTQGAD